MFSGVWVLATSGSAGSVRRGVRKLGVGSQWVRRGWARWGWCRCLRSGGRPGPDIQARDPGELTVQIAHALNHQLGVGSQFDEALAAATNRPVRHATARWWT